MSGSSDWVFSSNAGRYLVWWCRAPAWRPVRVLSPADLPYEALQEYLKALQHTLTSAGIDTSTGEPSGRETGDDLERDEKATVLSDRSRRAPSLADSAVHDSDSESFSSTVSCAVRRCGCSGVVSSLGSPELQHARVLSVSGGVWSR